LSSAPCFAQGAADYPNRPVRLIVPSTPGSSTDAAARLFGAGLTRELGQQFIIDNRGGAGGSIAALMIVRGNPDGYTLGLVAGSYGANAALYKLPYDAVKDVQPVSLLAHGPLIAVVHPSVNVKANSPQELIDLLRAKPGGFTFGSSGTGGTPHLTTELFMQLTKTKMIHVPYKGDSPAVADLVAGQLQVYFGSGPILVPLMKAGRLKGIAVTSEKRWPTLPELPAFNEQTVPGFVVMGMNGMLAPAKTPRAVVEKIYLALGRIIKEPAILERLTADGREPVYSTPDEYSRVLAREIGIWKKVVAEAGIKVE
jgi:tripartite-type tricarboxylate transporter receptor subunit TctC